MRPMKNHILTWVSIRVGPEGHPGDLARTVLGPGAPEPLLLLVDVDANDVVAALRETGARDEAYVASSNDSDIARAFTRSSKLELAMVKNCFFDSTGALLHNAGK